MLCPHRAWRDVAPEDLPHVGEPQILAPCGRCADCHLVQAQTHPDLRIVHRFLSRFHPDARIRDLKASTISIEVVREFLIDALGHKPVRGQGKVFILRDAHLLRGGAENALLKNLEEPPDDTTIILLTHVPHQLRETTRSRCQPIEFAALPCEFVAAQILAGRPDLDAKQAEWYAAFSGGSIGRAVEAVEENLYAVHRELTPIWTTLASGRADIDVADLLHKAEALAEVYQRRDRELSDSEALRTAVRTVLSLGAAHFAEELRKSVHSRGEAFSVRLLCDVLDRFREADVHVNTNANVTLCLEALVFDVAALIGRMVPTRRN